ncbi:MAG: 30S ribosomal protein S9 [Candidatus Wildermuthbacteria bacterium]|nr:30S ribosomal protein S9 [Candidatus Wildermuthbacteria bacterium]
MTALKDTKKKSKKKTEIQEIPALEGKYYEGIGRRKTAVARVRIAEQEKESFFLVNGKPMAEYFQDAECQRLAQEILEKITFAKPLSISAYVQGGGIRVQAEAVRHGLARALVEFDPALRSQLRALKVLTRDPRMRERKKFGLKRARRARQWRKR